MRFVVSALLAGACFALAGCGGGGGGTASAPATPVPAQRHFDIVLASSFTSEPGTAASPLHVPIGLFSAILVRVVDQNGIDVGTTVVAQLLTGGACVTVQPQQQMPGEFQITAASQQSCVNTTSTIAFSDTQGDTYTYNVLITSV